MPVSFAQFETVRDRRALSAVAEEYMASIYEDVSTLRRVRYEAGFFKTYMIEANVGSDDVTGDQRDVLLQKLAQLGRLDIVATAEPGFYIGKRVTQELHDIYFIDAVNPRFWLVHTPTVTGRSDRVLHENVLTIRGLDSAWLPTDFLETATRNGRTQIGVGTRFTDGLYVDDPDHRTEFRMRLWGSVARDVTEVLREHPRLRRFTAISSVRLKTYVSDEYTSNDTLYYSGKVTVNGNSFAAHQGLVSELFRGSYRNAIEHRIEGASAVRMSEAGRLRGRPLLLVYADAPEPDIGLKVAALLTGKKPHRFWGIPQATPGGRLRVTVSDLHLGGRFTISADDVQMQIYAYEGLCGNAIARWVTLFQQNVNATARLVDPVSGDYVFS